MSSSVGIKMEGGGVCHSGTQRESDGRVSSSQRFGAILGAQGTSIFLPGSTGKTGERGDRTEFYVLEFCVPCLLPKSEPPCKHGLCHIHGWLLTVELL